MVNKEDYLGDLINKVRPKNGEAVKLKQTSGDHYDSNHNVNHREQLLVDSYDNKETIVKYQKMIKDLRSGKIDMAGAFNKISPEALVKMLSLMQSGSEKVQLEAAKEFLDRAGHGKVNKVAIAGTLDPGASKEELISVILGLSKKTNEIEVVDDVKDNAQSVEESE